MEKLDAIDNLVNTCIANNQTYKNTKMINTKLLKIKLDEIVNNKDKLNNC